MHQRPVCGSGPCPTNFVPSETAKIMTMERTCRDYVPRRVSTSATWQYLVNGSQAAFVSAKLTFERFVLLQFAFQIIQIAIRFVLDGTILFGHPRPQVVNGRHEFLQQKQTDQPFSLCTPSAATSHLECMRSCQSCSSFSCRLLDILTSFDHLVTPIVDAAKKRNSL